MDVPKIWTRLASFQTYCLKTTFDPSRRIPWRAEVTRSAGQQKRDAWFAYGTTELDAKKVTILKMVSAGERILVPGGGECP